MTLFGFSQTFFNLLYMIKEIMEMVNTYETTYHLWNINC